MRCSSTNWLKRRRTARPPATSETTNASINPPRQLSNGSPFYFRVELHAGEPFVQRVNARPPLEAFHRYHDLYDYQFADLPSPDTYLITFTVEGFSQEAIALELEPGAAITNADQDMQSGTGSLTGTVSGPDRKPGGGGANQCFSPPVCSDM